MEAPGGRVPPEVVAQQKKEQEEARHAFLSQVLSTEAVERLQRIHLVKPEKARSIEDIIIKNVQSGNLKPPVSDSRVVDVIDRINETTERKTRVRIERRHTLDSDSDEDF
eukprot:TRINITY_DN26_c0_g5_i1.p2 TRINITY_DN26_c0_g5~~TRINITY_DN26_c0_g5_i1.p2  ORF type:complete len:110 (+),score=36.71 TRINITY_DN26_c0_g5_i1:213-542(+)